MAKTISPRQKNNFPFIKLREKNEQIIVRQIMLPILVHINKKMWMRHNNKFHLINCFVRELTFIIFQLCIGDRVDANINKTYNVYKCWTTQFLILDFCKELSFLSISNCTKLLSLLSTHLLSFLKICKIYILFILIFY